MTGHLFLLNSQLYFTGEELPEKPPVLPEYMRDGKYPLAYLDNTDLWIAYHASLASIRERATLVGNQEMAKQYWWVQETPSEGISHLDWLKTREEGEFYPIDCDVRYEERPTGIISGGLIPQGQVGGKGLTHHTKTVVFLSPLSSVSEKEETQDELWGEILKQSTIQFYNKNIIVDLKSRFKITRIK